MNAQAAPVRHWIANPSTSPECGCGWFPTHPSDDPIGDVEQHCREENAKQ